MNRKISQICYGLPSTLRVEEQSTPLPKKGQVLVRVRAACLNSWDWDRLTGRPRTWRLLSGIFSPRRQVPGSDFAGVVEALGEGVTRLKVGDAVIGDLSVNGAWGAFADYCVAPEKILALKNPDLSFEDAASLPQAGMLALQGIRDALDPQAGQRLLISGAGGGVGVLALQMAKARGAHVTVTDKKEKLSRLLDLGADEAIAWPDPGFYNSDKTWDRILDVNISRAMGDYEQALAPGGILAVVGGSPGALLRFVFKGRRLARKRGKKFEMVAQKTTEEDLAELQRLAADGTAKPLVDSVYPLEKAVEAFERFGSGDFVGKVVMKMDG